MPKLRTYLSVPVTSPKRDSTGFQGSTRPWRRLAYDFTRWQAKGGNPAESKIKIKHKNAKKIIAIPKTNKVSQVNR